MQSVLAAWGLADLPCRLHAVRENQVYAVGTSPGGAFPAYALRHHRHGLRTSSQILAELSWMAQLADQGLTVPRPQATLDRSYVLQQDGQLYSLITWLPGHPLGQGQQPLQLSNPLDVFFNLGRLLARLHDLPSPKDLDRPRWDLAGLLGDDPLWGRFWAHPDLQAGERDLLLNFRDLAWTYLAQRDLDLRLIHADPLQENVLVQGGAVALIDFDDCAYGYRAFDLVTPLVQRLPNANYRDLRQALLKGYGSYDEDLLRLMLPIRCLTYLGWIQDKMQTPQMRAMSARILRRAVTQVQIFMAQT